jgi:hypothetical protein
MRCIFCKNPSDGSTSKEHILPESLGNSLHTLPPGIVCDSCNNYFSREVEKPFLESAAIRSLRFAEALPSKRGRIPPLNGVLTPVGSPAVVTRHNKGPFFADVQVPEDAIPKIAQLRTGKLLFEAPPGFPTGKTVSRLLAKCGLEAMAWRLLSVSDWVEYLVNEKQLDQIRDHARKGYTSIWPYYVRPLYPSNKPWIENTGRVVQVMHEFDVLKTDWDEWFFIMVVFGMEFTINYGGPEIDGYQRWLRENGNVSPLYTGKNSAQFS